MLLLQKMLDFFKHFQREERGAVAIITGLLMVPLALLTGMSLDFARYTYVRDRLSFAADAAALAAQRYPTATASTIANAFFKANYPTSLFDVTPAVSVAASSTSVSTIVTVQGSLSTLFAQLVGVTSLPINIKSQATTITLGQNNEVIPQDLNYTNGYLSILPEGSRQSQDFVDNLRVPPLILQENYTVTVRFAYENAGYNNSLGYYLIDSSGTIQSVKMIFPNVKSQSRGGSLVPEVTTVTLGTFSKGTQIGFFILSNGYNYNNFTNSSGTNYINLTSGQLVFGNSTKSPPSKLSDITLAKTTDQTPPHLYYVPSNNKNLFEVVTVQGTNQGIFHSISSSGLNTLKLNASQLQQIVGYGSSLGWIRLGFEDTNLKTQNVDSDFNDVVLDVNLGTLTTDTLFKKSRIVLSDPKQY